MYILSLPGYDLVSSGSGYQHFVGTRCIICRHLFRRRGLRYFPETIIIPNDYRGRCWNKYDRSVNPPFGLRQSSFRTSVFISLLSLSYLLLLYFSVPLPTPFLFF